MTNIDEFENFDGRICSEADLKNVAQDFSVEHHPAFEAINGSEDYLNKPKNYSHETELRSPSKTKKDDFGSPNIKTSTARKNGTNRKRRIEETIFKNAVSEY